MNAEQRRAQFDKFYLNLHAAYILAGNIRNGDQLNKDTFELILQQLRLANCEAQELQNELHDHIKPVNG